MVTFSVVIPTYNRAGYITKAIDSVLRQTFGDYEIIVIDDGSSDRTQTALQPYLEKIHYIYQDNAGVSAARNAGIRQATGKWIAFLDSDDEWLEEYLATQAAQIEKFPGAVAHIANAVTVGADRTRSIHFEEIRLMTIFRSKPDLLVEKPFGLIIEKSHWFLQPVVMRRDELLKTDLLNPLLSIAEDLDILARVALTGPISISREVLVEIHRREEAIEHLASQYFNKGIFSREAFGTVYTSFLERRDLTFREKLKVAKVLSFNRRALGNILLQAGRRLDARRVVQEVSFPLPIGYLPDQICLRFLAPQDIAHFCEKGKAHPAGRGRQRVILVGMIGAPSMTILCDQQQQLSRLPLPGDGTGRLNGVKILRFAHAFRNSGGGVEQYLRNLNNALLERNSMTIIQMHLVKEDDACDVVVEKIGQGTLIWVPSVFKQWERSPSTGDLDIKAKVKKLISKCLLRDSSSIERYHYLVLNNKVMEAFDTYEVDLAIFHWISVDSVEVFERAIQGKVPYFIINHFDNERLRLKSVKKWVKHATACGGVSNVNVPSYVSSKFINVSDGIDPEFFTPENARPLHRDFSDPIIFMPSRITPFKGHFDIVQAAALLQSSGLRTKVVFAGREDSAAFAAELNAFIHGLRMEDHILFTGQLNASDLRDWYGASAVVVLPSYSEGLPRVLLEAQAMGKPVVAYDTGGVSEAMKDGASGYLVRKGDFRSLADKVQELLSSNDKRREMGRCGKDFVTGQFSPLSLAIRHEDLYLTALSRDRNITAQMTVT